MLYTVAIAVCLSATPVQECQEPTALAWIIAPEKPPTMGGCMQHGLLYAATSNLVATGSYAKVFCSARETAGRTAALPF